MTAVRGCNIPEELLYWVEKHVWVRDEGDDVLTIGITDPAQHLAARVVAVTTKKVGKQVERGMSVATVESGKWRAGPPRDGEIIASTRTRRRPTLVNTTVRGRLDRPIRPPARDAQTSSRHRRGGVGGVHPFPWRRRQLHLIGLSEALRSRVRDPADLWYDVRRLAPAESDGTVGMTDRPRPAPAKCSTSSSRSRDGISTLARAATIETARPARSDTGRRDDRGDQRRLRRTSSWLTVTLWPGWLARPIPTVARSEAGWQGRRRSPAGGPHRRAGLNCFRSRTDGRARADPAARPGR